MNTCEGIAVTLQTGGHLGNMLAIASSVFVMQVSKYIIYNMQYNVGGDLVLVQDYAT